MSLSEKRSLISALHKEYSVREICETLGFNRSSFYYHPQEDPSEELLRSEIEKLAGQYPRYGYRRITQLLLRMGYTVGTRRVARLMKANNLLVSVKRACQTTKSLQGERFPWRNRLENVEVSRQDQVWVADITYVRLNGRFIYVCLLMDVFTRMIKAWQISQHLNQSLTLKPLEEALCHSVPEIHHSDQGVQYLSKAYITTLEEHGVEISVAQRGRPWENGYAERLIRTLKEEEVDINDYQNITEARDRIGHFITQVYNQKRPHSALGYLTPIEFQRKTLS
ncbi:MAG: IS3 family transposase [Candidatus Poribacteria bacterium]|nr:IS3 family transposase [Candidatus Poribacteria bacterium]